MTADLTWLTCALTWPNSGHKAQDAASQTTTAAGELAGQGPIPYFGTLQAYVSEERMRDAVIADFTVTENLMLVAGTDPA
jgi:hypothetical protein